MQPDRGDGWTERFDGEQLWIEADGQKAYALPPTRAHLARSVEWTLASRWLWSDGSPFERNFSRAPERIPTVQLALGDNPVRPEIELDPGTLQPSALRVPGNPAVQWQFEDWRTRRGFPGPIACNGSKAAGPPPPSKPSKSGSSLPCSPSRGSAARAPCRAQRPSSPVR
ncbi:MAG: hypothetical protein R3F17_12895 [Planctomycetota bacterium]